MEKRKAGSETEGKGGRLLTKISVNVEEGTGREKLGLYPRIYQISGDRTPDSRPALQRDEREGKGDVEVSRELARE